MPTFDSFFTDFEIYENKSPTQLGFPANSITNTYYLLQGRTQGEARGFSYGKYTL